MSNSENTTQYDTCQKCHSSITDKGKGWMHGPERSIRFVPYHFPVPMGVTR